MFANEPQAKRKRTKLYYKPTRQNHEKPLPVTNPASGMRYAAAADAFKGTGTLH